MARPRRLSDAELVTAAARAVATHGPQALTLADVAAEAGVAAATLVQRFGSKRELLLAVAASGPAVAADAFTAARAGSRTVLGAIERALGALASEVSDPDEVANHLAFLAMDLTDPAFREHAARHTDALRAELEAALRAAAAAGELELRVRRPLAEALLAAYHGTLLMWAIDRRGEAGDRVRAQVRLALRPYRPRAPG